MVAEGKQRLGASGVGEPEVASPQAPHSNFDDLPDDWRCRTPAEARQYLAEQWARARRQSSRALTPAEREAEE